MKGSYVGFLILILVGFNICIFGQHADSVAVLKDDLHSFLKLKISDYTGFEWEQRIARKSALSGFAGLRYAMQADGFSISNTPLNTKLIISPCAFLEYRNYYNLYKRISRGKNIRINSANFLFTEIMNTYPIRNQNYFNLLLVQGWGLQRVLGRQNLWRKIILDLHWGIIEHFYYDKPPKGGFNYVKIEQQITSSLSYVF